MDRDGRGSLFIKLEPNCVPRLDRHWPASQYLAEWFTDHTEGLEAASCTLHYVGPFCEETAYLSRSKTNITASLPNNIGNQAQHGGPHEPR